VQAPVTRFSNARKRRAVPAGLSLARESADPAPQKPGVKVTSFIRDAHRP
jgi:hypothetical protein